MTLTKVYYNIQINTKVINMLMLNMNLHVKFISNPCTHQDYDNINNPPN
jgi:hypothetical protein